MKIITVTKEDRILNGKITLPASKSISNRLLMIRALRGKKFRITNLSKADDTILLQHLLKEVEGNGKRRAVFELDTRNAGTVMRFLAAYLTMKPGKWILTGSERMRQRPIGIQVEALRKLGADIEYLSKLGYPPLMIKGRSLKGGEVDVDASVSSQFISAILMIAPYLPGGLTLRMSGLPVSFPYIEMTLGLMKEYGIMLRREKNRIRVEPGTYSGKDYRVEADWSAAAFWYEAAALSEQACLELPALEQNSLQGDAILALVYQNFGVQTEYTPNGVILTQVPRKSKGFYFDFTGYPDIAPAVISTCAGLGIRGRFEGLQSLRIKETDRLEALQREYEKLGVNVEAADVTELLKAFEFAPSHLQPGPGLVMETYGDHRMAMTFAPLALKLGSIRIKNPDVVAKSYPGFWEDLRKTGFVLSEQ
ncbi:MAG: 3-phosphoshikimate 1-carboxyvinyltransferase [bacterium]